MRGLSAASLVRARRLVQWGSFGSCTTWGSAVRTDEESSCNESRDLITESLNHWNSGPGAVGSWYRVHF